MGTRISKIAATAALTVLAMAQGATATVTDFRLPPSDSATPAGPEAEGPTAEDIPQSRPRPVRPEQEQTRAPTAAPTPAPTSTPVIQQLPPQEEPAPVDSPAAVQQSRPRTGQQGSAGTADAAPPAEQDAADENSVEDAPPPSAAATPAPQPSLPAPANSAEEEQDSGGMAAIIAALVVLLGVGGALWWRRKDGGASATAAPVIERPRAPAPARSGDVPEPLPPQPDPSPAPADVSAAEPLRVTLAPGKLGLTLMNATLSYRLEIANDGAEPVSNLSVSADMIAAHASHSREHQLSGPGPDAAPRHRIERLAPGETRLVSGEFRIPLSDIVPIRQGSAALLLPLARFRLAAEGAEPRSLIFAVGQSGAQPDGPLVPFRLDQGPRIYQHVVQRAFA